MDILIIVAGVIAFLYGIAKISGKKIEDISRDSTSDKAHLSKRSRYFIGRYWAGFQFFVAGIGAIILGLILHFS